MKTNPHLSAFKNLFSIPLTDETQPMVENIGRWVKFKRPKAPVQFLPYRINHLQKIHDGSITYRGSNQAQTFGCPLSPNDIEFISEDDARELWSKYIFTKIYPPSYVEEFKIRQDTLDLVGTFNPRF